MQGYLLGTVSSTATSGMTKTRCTSRLTFLPSRTGKPGGRCVSIQRNAQSSESAPTSASGKTPRTSFMAMFRTLFTAISTLASISARTWAGYSATQASRTLGFLRHNLKVCSKEMRASAYIAMVHPALDYVSTTWDPQIKQDIQTFD